MAAKTPIRAVFTGADATGLSEFQSGEFVDYAFGGTGLTSLGSAGQVLKINSGGTALEYGNVEAVINIDGATDLTGSTLVTGDQIILSDGGTEGRVTLAQLDTLFSGTTQTLTNKTLTSPTITGTGAIAGTFTGNITGDVTGNADTATTLETARTDLSDTADIALLDSTQTLTNKTLTSPTITGTGAIAGTFTGNITGDVTGNADTATTLETARTIADQSFDGSSNITIASTDLSNTSDVVLLNSTQTLTNKNLTSPTITGTGAIAGTFTGNITGDVTGNADTATTLETARTIAGQSFDGSANITIASTDLSNTSDVVLLTSTQTLTNKTIDASSNTISNIGDSQLTTGIDAAKISSGSVSNTEFDYLDGVTSSVQTQLDNKSTRGFAIAMAIAL